MAVLAARSTRGRPWALFAGLGSTTLDNVTTTVMIAPITLSVAEILEIDPVPLILGETLLSNFGGTATLTGDPPNILIGSAAGFSFMDFLRNLAPIVLIVSGLCLVLMRFVFRRELARTPKNVETLAKLEPRKAITEPRRFKAMLAVFLFVVGLVNDAGKRGDLEGRAFRSADNAMDGCDPLLVGWSSVSYTHLTLPTIYSV